MRVKYPVEAFALAIVVFSAGMKASFAAGCFVILAVVFAEFLKNLLEGWLPDWSTKACVAIASAAVSAGAFQIGFATLAIPVVLQTWLLAAIIGLLAARHVFANDLQADYGTLLFESAIVWGCFILLGAIRELFGVGKIFGYELMEFTMQSGTFLEVFFGFLTAGMVLAFANGILKEKSAKSCSLFVVLPVVLLAQPFTTDLFGPIGSVLFTMVLPVILFISAQRTLRFSRTGTAFRGLPVEMLSMGFIYMILSIY